MISATSLLISIAVFVWLFEKLPEGPWGFALASGLVTVWVIMTFLCSKISIDFKKELLKAIRTGK